MRGYIIQGTSVKEEMPSAVAEGWSNVEECVTCDFGIAEEVVVLLTLADDSYEVGIGGSLRPYAQKYTGTDPETASEIFISTILHLAGYKFLS